MFYDILPHQLSCHNRHQILKSVIQGGWGGVVLFTTEAVIDNAPNWKYLEHVGRECSDYWLDLYRTVSYVHSKGVCAHTHVLGATGHVSDASHLL